MYKIAFIVKFIRTVGNIQLKTRRKQGLEFISMMKKEETWNGKNLAAKRPGNSIAINAIMCEKRMKLIISCREKTEEDQR